jgi:hypothetical protein
MWEVEALEVAIAEALRLNSPRLTARNSWLSSKANGRKAHTHR